MDGSQRTPTADSPAVMSAIAAYRRSWTIGQARDELTNEKKLSPVSIAVATAALRFVYTVTLNKRWDVEAVLPMSQQPKTLPEVSVGG